MQFLNNREILPVFYGDFPVKVIPDFTFGPNNITIRPHWHERFEMLLIKEGMLDLYCANEHIPLKVGDIAIISPKLIHSGIAGKTGVIYDVLIFDTDHFFNNTAASELFIKPIYDNSIIFENKTSSPEIVSQFKAIVG